MGDNEQVINNDKMYKLFDETQELIAISKNNITHLIERDFKLNHLENVSSHLLKSSIDFKEKCTLPWYKKYGNYFVGGGIGVGTVALIKIGCILLL